MFFSGCDLFTYKRPFDDAYYNNNFIAHIGFDQFVGGDPAPVEDPITHLMPSAVTGQWDFAYRYEAWNDYPYITLTDSGSSASSFDAPPSGLDSNAPVYRLAVANLLTGGDFEIDDGGLWTPTGNADAVLSSSSPISGLRNMQLKADSGEELRFAPDGISTAINIGYTYRFFFRYSSPNAFQVTIGTASLQLALGAQTTTTSFGEATTIPAIIFSPPALHTSFTGLKVDDFQLTISGKMSLRLLLSPDQTSPVLEGGVYSFSVWVHTDPASFIDRSPYQLESFFITMRPVSPASLSASSSQYASSGGWQKLTATLEPQSLQFESGELVPVLELVLNFNDTKPGQILLAQPELRFNADGL